MFPLAQRMKLVSDSITLAVSAKAGALKKAGVDVVGFGAGSVASGDDAAGAGPASG